MSFRPPSTQGQAARIEEPESRKSMKQQYIQLSDFLVDFISDRGGVMSVFNSATVIG
jgi:hypothetical protein